MNYVSKCAHYIQAESRGIKVSRAGRQSYGDDAIGYVEVKRDKNLCIVRARITPEHKVRSKAYHVEAQIEENEFVSIKSILCKDCPASQGGCKHAYAFLTWLHRRTEEKPSTSSSCYWKKPKLSRAGKVARTAADLKSSQRKRKIPQKEDDGDFFADFLQAVTNARVYNIQLYIHYSTLSCTTHLSMLMLMKNFKEAGGSTAEKFMEYCQSFYKADVLAEIQECTLNQSDSPMWYKIKFGRWSASNAHECAQCKTPDGSTVEKILGAKFKPTQAMKRGIDIESSVLEVVIKTHGHKNIERSGYIINKDFPVAGCSPDGINNEAIYEVKSPSKNETKKYYIKENGSLQHKVEAQIQVQMLLTKRNVGYLCLASPTFELDKSVEVIRVPFDKNKAEKVANKANLFWCKYVFSHLNY
ncbi:hypothetical protein B566_EDAN006770 [Ephemera danica]|nr:hypothetical protein B566_EDAN006770 [Ephemera danica]